MCKSAINKRIGDIIQKKNLDKEYVLARFSHDIWEIGDIKTIKETVSDSVFTFHIVVNVIGNYKGDGWQFVLEDQTDLLPYISSAMYEIGLPTVGEATKNIENIFNIGGIDTSTPDNKQFCELVNFIHGHSGKWTVERLLQYSEQEQKEISKQYRAKLEELDQSTSDLWNYGCPDNEGWGVVKRYLENHKDDYILR